MSDAACYLVMSDMSQAPLSDHLMHGYESRRDFCSALRKLIDRWHGRVGERIDERHGFLLLRFHDTPGGKPEEAWLPTYLLQLIDSQDDSDSDSSDEITAELNSIYGFG